MEPFSQALYAEVTGMRNHHAYKPLRGRGAKIAVWMWQVMLCLLHLNEETFARSFASFLPQSADILIEYDASLWGLGLKLTDLKDGRVIGCGGVQFPFDLGDESRWQNVAEFIAIVMGCVCLARAGYRNVGIN